MIIIIKYRKECRKDGNIHIISEEENSCPVCVGVLIVIGSRKRKVINNEGNEETLVIRRMRCKGCRKIHHELPDMIIPYKRHCAETIEKIINEDTTDVCCDFATEYRLKAWWATILLYFERAKASLQMKYGLIFPGKVTPGEIIRAIANTNLWIHTRTAMTHI